MNEIPEELALRLKDGALIPAIVQSASDNRVLMLAYMNEDSLKETLVSKYATYWSRSRNEIWKKGKSSGNFQKIIAISYDCDADAILLKVEQSGPACHTGESSCFHNPLL
jgi:phosphoribosyl-AMP cyclohydrolase